MRYRHPTGVRLALLSGHVAHVGPDWIELHARFHQSAVREQCEVEQNFIPAVPDVVPEASPQAVVNVDADSVIRRALTIMIERDEAGDFTGTGQPSIKVVEKLGGIQVDKGKVYSIFRAMKAEAEASSESEGADD